WPPKKVFAVAQGRGFRVGDGPRRVRVARLAADEELTAAAARGAFARGAFAARAAFGARAVFASTGAAAIGGSAPAACSSWRGVAPAAAAISRIVRPDTTDRGLVAVTSSWLAYWSRCLIRSHWRVPRVRTSTHEPAS